MIKQIRDFNKVVAITGYRDVQISNVEETLNLIRERLSCVTVQIFNAKLIAGWEHLYFATLNALLAFKNKTNISKSLAIECLLYASAHRQIRVAFDLIGIKPNLTEIAVLIVAENRDVVENSLSKIPTLIPSIRDDSILSLSKEKETHIRRLFDISDTELAACYRNGEKKALLDLVIEHVAISATHR